MKKYLLTALLGVFGLVGAFVSADSVDGFTSSSQICKNSFVDLDLDQDTYFDFFNCDDIVDSDSSVYLCVSTNDLPYYSSIPEVVSSTVNSDVVCYDSPINTVFGNNVISSCNGVYEGYCSNGFVYFSNSPITYEGGDIGESGGSGLPILTGGTNMFSGIITGLNSTLSEFIPYLVYLGLGILGVIIGFVAIKWLMNRIRSKVFGTFSGGRRR